MSMAIISSSSSNQNSLHKSNNPSNKSLQKNNRRASRQNSELNETQLRKKIETESDMCCRCNENQSDISIASNQINEKDRWRSFNREIEQQKREEKRNSKERFRKLPPIISFREI